MTQCHKRSRWCRFLYRATLSNWDEGSSSLGKEPHMSTPVSACAESAAASVSSPLNTPPPPTEPDVAGASLMTRMKPKPRDENRGAHHRITSTHQSQHSHSTVTAQSQHIRETRIGEHTIGLQAPISHITLTAQSQHSHSTYERR